MSQEITTKVVSGIDQLQPDNTDVYTNVLVTNSTTSSVDVGVTFLGGDHAINQVLQPLESVQISRLGLLLNEVSAIIDPTGRNIKAISYKSSGTAFPNFAVIELSPTLYVCTRVVT